MYSISENLVGRTYAYNIFRLPFSEHHTKPQSMCIYTTHMSMDICFRHHRINPPEVQVISKWIPCREGTFSRARSKYIERDATKDVVELPMDQLFRSFGCSFLHTNTHESALIRVTHGRCSPSTKCERSLPASSRHRVQNLGFRTV